MPSRYCPGCRAIHGEGEACPRGKASGWRRHKARSGYERGLPRSVRTEALRRHGWRCAGCGIGPGDGVSLQVDHVVPKSRGGTDDQTNLQPLCAGPNSGQCHRRKTQAEANAARTVHARGRRNRR